MNVNDGHRERMRNRFLKSRSFDDYEPHNILEFLLHFTIPRRDTNKIAHGLIRRFGSLSGVFEAPYEELLKCEGIGPNSAIHLAMIAPLAKAYMMDKREMKPTLDSLDDKLQVIKSETLMEGSINAVNISIPLIVRSASVTGAAWVALAHNHPKGFCIPSHSDISTTLQVGDALKTIGVRLLDHIIVANDDFVSLKDSGIIHLDDFVD